MNGDLIAVGGNHQTNHSGSGVIGIDPSSDQRVGGDNETSHRCADSKKLALLRQDVGRCPILLFNIDSRHFRPLSLKHVL